MKKPTRVNQEPVGGVTVERIWTRREVAKLIGKSPKTIDKMAERGILKPIRVKGSRKSLGYANSTIIGFLRDAGFSFTVAGQK